MATLDNLQYSLFGPDRAHELPQPLKTSLKLIDSFFESNTNNKLCLVFPSKESSAQWLSIPRVFAQIAADFLMCGEEIPEFYKEYRPGDKLVLNNKAIVEWVGIKERIIGAVPFKGPTFRTKHSNRSSAAEITIRFSEVMILQKAPRTRTTLSSINAVKEARSKRSITPLENILKLTTHGNVEFIRKALCVVSKFRVYDDALEGLELKGLPVKEYFKSTRLREDGTVGDRTPLIIANNFSSLFLHLEQSGNVSQILVDGFAPISDRRSDFADIDRRFSIPTILITDLSETEFFQDIRDYGFDFYNFTKENITIENTTDDSPFSRLERKLKAFISFSPKIESCNDSLLETIVQKLHSLPSDDSNNDLSLLNAKLVQLTNHSARICHVLSQEEQIGLEDAVGRIADHYSKSQLWLEGARRPIEEIIEAFRLLVAKFVKSPTEKCARLLALLQEKKCDYVLCATDAEAKALEAALTLRFPDVKVASVAEFLAMNIWEKTVRAVLVGWIKSANMNLVVTSFRFSELIILFYEFEIAYWKSLSRRQMTQFRNTRSTMDINGNHLGTQGQGNGGYDELFTCEGLTETSPVSTIDIVNFELKMENTQYARYSGIENLAESCPAKRIGFENDTFIYATDSHKFMVVNELIDQTEKEQDIRLRRFDSLRLGDLIAFINTDRDVLVELIEGTTDPKELSEITKWIDLWKGLLREYYVKANYDFKSLVRGLRKNDCQKHETTIRTWLQDVNMIGPEDDADLASIALLSNSKLLLENIPVARAAIKQMTGLRMKASDFIRNKIKNKLADIASTSMVNSSLAIPDLGNVAIVRISELKTNVETIDRRYVNRLLYKELI